MSKEFVKAPWALAAMGLVLGLAGVSLPSMAADDPYLEAQKVVEAATQRKSEWDGPTTGPMAQPNKLIVYVSDDQRNGGALGVGKGVEEAAKAIGWEFRLIDGLGTVAGRTSALNQAIALKPDGIVLGTVDARVVVPGLETAKEEGIVVVGWHSRAAPGPAPEFNLFTNLTTAAQDVATVAASYAIAEAKGKAGVVIYTDSTYDISIVKSNRMKEVVEKCSGCTVLELKDTPLNDTSARIPPLTASFLQQHGDKWTHALGINDLYFDAAAPALQTGGAAPEGPPRNISAGDGSIAAYERIRANDYQAATVPEPLNLHGWQAVDELNRAFAGEGPTDYVAPVHLVTPENIAYDGGPDNIYDPDNGYREAYKKIWGVK